MNPPTRRSHWTSKGNTARYGGNGATPQIIDLNRGSLAPWAKPGILRILALFGGAFSASHLMQLLD
jgi:hypothetical protein